VVEPPLFLERWVLSLSLVVVQVVASVLALQVKLAVVHFMVALVAVLVDLRHFVDVLVGLLAVEVLGGQIHTAQAAAVPQVATHTPERQALNH
jgi:hypothetical protein